MELFVVCCTYVVYFKSSSYRCSLDKFCILLLVQILNGTVSTLQFAALQERALLLIQLMFDR